MQIKRVLNWYLIKDIDSIQAFLTSVLNNRTLNLKGNILYIEDQKSIAWLSGES